MKDRRCFRIETRAELERFIAEVIIAFKMANPGVWPATEIFLNPLISLTRAQLPLPPKTKRMFIVETPDVVRWEEEDDLNETVLVTAQLPKMS